MADKIQLIGTAALPVFICVILISGFVKKIKVFDVFLVGAGEGLETVLRLIPTLIGIMTAVELFSSSGFTDFISELLKPVSERFGFPSEIIPYALIRPISGGGSTALLNNLFDNFGPDSYIGKIASVLAGSSETTFYAVSVYYQSIDIKNIRHTLIAAVTADIVALITSIIFVRLIFNL